MHQVLLVFCTLGASPSEAAETLNIKLTVDDPAYPKGNGPQVAIDAGHHNLHTRDGGYRPFATVLEGDGYRTSSLSSPFTADSLDGVDVLVISNPLNARNRSQENWKLPTPSAFTKTETEALWTWVNEGGSLLLILDHMPFAGAGQALARRFGFAFSNGDALRKNPREGTRAIRFKRGRALPKSPIREGRSPDERVEYVVTYRGSAFKPASRGQDGAPLPPWLRVP